MSAYFVEASCIDRILTAWRTARAVVGIDELPTETECIALGRQLLRENARSVAHLYASMGDGERLDMQQAANAYNYRIEANPLPVLSDGGDPLQVGRVLIHGQTSSVLGSIVGDFDRSALGEYDYQACETDDYRETLAGKAIATIEAETEKAIALMMPAIKAATKKAEANRKASAEQQLRNDVARLVAENPHLTQGGREVVEKNIRAELKLAFPKVKFSVRKEGYSSTGISWADGPTCDQVDAIVRRHKAGHWDGMTDSYDYHRTPWGEAFGSVQYVSTRREHSDAAKLAAIQRVAKRYNVEPISLDDLRQRGWQLSPISNAWAHEHQWAALVNLDLEHPDDNES